MAFSATPSEKRRYRIALILNGLQPSKMAAHPDSASQAAEKTAFFSSLRTVARTVSTTSMSNLEKVSSELALYAHPFFEFAAAEVTGGIEVSIRSKVETVHTPEFRFTLSEREIEHRQFRWSFQGLLYGSMNDYVVELFTSSPGDA